ncbi:hypothetical protein EBS02_00755 [bacterium]|nr:hypothetical protein [bacterium]
MGNVMKIINKILDYSKTPFILAAVIFVCSLVLLSIFKTAETQLNHLNNAMVIAEEMANSSDDLTNYARYYVTTKDDQWKKRFENIIKVRNGEEPNKDNVKISFKDKVKSIGFSTSESDLILKSEALSNNLAVLEVKAFDSISKGKIEQNWEVQQFYYTQAQMFMFGEEYNKHKNEIVNTIDKFTNDVYARLKSDYQMSMNLAWILITIINISLIILVISVQHHNKTISTSSNAKVPANRRKIKVT